MERDYISGILSSFLITELLLDPSAWIFRVIGIYCLRSTYTPSSLFRWYTDTHTYISICFYRHTLGGHICTRTEKDTCRCTSIPSMHPHAKDDSAFRDITLYGRYCSESSIAYFVLRAHNALLVPRTRAYCARSFLRFRLRRWNRSTTLKVVPHHQVHYFEGRGVREVNVDGSSSGPKIEMEGRKIEK